MDTLISNVTVVTMNEKLDVLFGACIGVADGKISYIGKNPPADDKPATIIDGTGMVAIPGLINCHTHLATSALRNLLDGETAAETLRVRLQKESKMDTRTAKAAATIAIAECLRFGTTSVSDLYDYPEAVAQAVYESGIKANIALSANRYISDTEDFDFETDEQCRELCRMTDTWHEKDSGRIRIDGGIYAPYTSNHQLWEGIADYCKEKNLGFQLHLAQSEEEEADSLDRTGLTSAQLLNCHRVFSVPVTAAVCSALTQEDRETLGKKQVSVVATPVACGKQGFAYTPVLQTVKAGLNLCLGTGGAVECGNLDLFENMRFLAAAERETQKTDTPLPASAVLMMATVCGAKAQGRENRCGMLKTGMDADIVLVDFSAPHLIPCHNVMNALVYSAKGGDVAMTMVQGKILYQNGLFPTLDLKTAVEDLTQYGMSRLFDEKE